MRRLSLALIVLLCMACAADPEPGAGAPAPAEPPPPAAAGSEAVEATGAAPDKVALVGGAKVGAVLPADWQRINELTRKFYDGELETLYAEFSDEAQKELSLEALLAMRAGLLANHGEEVQIVATAKEENQGYVAYKRAARFSNDERLIEVAWVIAPDESVAGLYVTPDRSKAE